jgi:hypothetical protein
LQTLIFKTPPLIPDFRFQAMLSGLSVEAFSAQADAFAHPIVNKLRI